MVYLLKQDCKRIFLSYRFLGGIFLGLLICFIGIAPYVGKEVVGDSEYFNAVYFFLRAHSSGATSILPLLAPLIVVIPFITEFYNEYSTGFINYIMIRTKKGEYLFSKIIVGGLAGGSMLAIPLTLTLLIVSIIYPWPKYLPENLPTGAFSNLFQQSQLGYVLLLIFISFCFGFTYAVLGLTISIYIRNKYIAMIGPFFFYFIMGMLGSLLGLDYLEPSVTLVPSSNIYATPVIIFTELAGILILSILSFSIKLRGIGIKYDK